MNKKESIRAVKMSKTIYAYVRYSENEGCYFKVSKKDSLNMIENSKGNVSIFTTGNELFIKS